MSVGNGGIMSVGNGGIMRVVNGGIMSVINEIQSWKETEIRCMPLRHLYL